MTETAHLDTVDLAILRELQNDGRIANVDLARVVGLSPSATLERVRRLERERVVEGYVARVNPKALGQNVTMFVAVSLREHHRDAVREFEVAIAGVPEVLECHHVAGESDFLLKILVADVLALRDVLVEQVSALPNVGRVRSTLVLATSKHTLSIALRGGGTAGVATATGSSSATGGAHRRGTASAGTAISNSPPHSVGTPGTTPDGSARTAVASGMVSALPTGAVAPMELALGGHTGLSSTVGIPADGTHPLAGSLGVTAKPHDPDSSASLGSQLAPVSGAESLATASDQPLRSSGPASQHERAVNGEQGASASPPA